MNNVNQVHKLAIAIGAIATLIYGYWRWCSTEAGDLGVTPLFATSLVVAFLTFYLWWVSYQQKQDISLKTVLLFALLFRVIGVGAFPILEDDVYRFLWDGRQTIELGNPYLSTPADHFDDERVSEEWQSTLDSINYPDVPTVYGPTAQYSFALAYLISAGEIWSLQLVLILADILLILILAKATSARNIMLYAWSPLIIKEFAFSAHPDVIGALFLLLGFYLMKRKHAALAGASLAFALGVKVFAVVAIPLILLLNWRAYLSLALTAVLLALPFGVVTAWLPGGLSAMSQDWTFNAPIYLSLLGEVPLSLVKLVMALVLAGLLLLLFIKTWRSRHSYSLNSPPRIDWAFAALFFCSPVLNPWYLVWMLAFACLRPTAWAWVASIVVMIAYFSGINLSEGSLDLYQQPIWLVWLQFGLVALAAVAARGRVLPRRAPEDLLK